MSRTNDPRSDDPSPDATRQEEMLVHLVEHIQDAVVEFEHVDGAPVVTHVNRAFVDVFGYDRETVIGSSLNDHIVPEWEQAEARALDERTAAGRINYRRVRRQTKDGLRTFLYRGIPYTDENGTVYGFAVYTDLSRIQRHERRLQVLNRVLRHNLRNEVMAIRGWTDEVRGQLETEGRDPPAALDWVEEAALTLEGLADEAAAIHGTLHAEPSSGEDRIDCVGLLNEVVEAFRESHPHATIEPDLPTDQPVSATDRLRPAFEALVENAIVHNPASIPRVWLSIESVERGWIDVCVVDDGPRIPSTQREIITGDREITQLTHGNGLGLWLVKWTCDLFGGQLRFESRQPTGNRVRLRLPAPTDAE